MALAYVTAMIAIFIALLMRVIVLWLGMVFSPLLIAASILGVAGDGDKVKTQVITHLIMPLKIAAAFGVSFIMIAAMFEFDPGFGNGFLQFGPALSQFGQNGYAIMWQIATVVIFWKTAFWALEGSAAEGIVKQVESAGEGIGKYVARAATIDRQLFTVGKGSQTAPVSLGTLLKTPQAIQTAHENDMREKQTKAFQALGILDETAGEATRALGDLTTKVKDLKAVDIMKEIDTAFHTRGTDFFSKATKTDKAGLTSVLGGEKFKGYETEVEAFKREFEAGESKKAGVALAELVKKVVPERNKRKPEYYEVKGTTETGTEATGAEGQAFKITFVSGREKTYEKELLTPASPEALIKTLGAMGITPTALKPLSEEEIKSGVDELITANIFNGGEREEYIKALNTIKAKAK